MLGLLLGALASGCGEETSSGGEPGKTGAPYSLPVHAAEIPLDQVSWARGETLHLGVKKIDLGRAAEQYVLTPNAIVFVDVGGALWSGDGTAPPVRVADVGPARLAVSPDRKLLGLVDFEHGPPDRDGDSKAQLVVFDTRTGKQLMRTSHHISDTDDSIEQAELFEEGYPGVEGFDETSVYVWAALDRVRFPLDGGTPEVLDPTSKPPATPWYGAPSLFGEDQGRFVLQDEEGDFSVTSPDGRFVVARYPDKDGVIVFEAESGRRHPIRLSADDLVFGGWQGPSRFYAFARRSNEEVGLDGRVVTCEIKTGACDDISERITGDLEVPVLFDDNGESGM